MERFNFKKEIAFWVLLIIPFVYVIWIWNSLPDRVPIHFNVHGQPNGWGGRVAIFIMPGVNVFMYLLFLVVPLIDPKKNFESFKNSYYKIRLLVTIFMFAISLVAINAGVAGHLGVRWVTAPIFLLLALLGNFMLNIKANWFVGIRTPWTLSSDTTWKKTQVLFGRIWFYGGLLCFILSFVISDKQAFYLLLAFTFGSYLLAWVYSYWLYRKEEKIKIR